MKNNIQNLRGLRARLSLAVLVLSVGLGITPTYADSLYIGDESDNTVKRFDVDTRAFLGEFVKKGNSPIKGPRGLIFNSDGDLLVSNQNAGANKSGEILKHDGATGEFLGALVPHNDPNAPFAPRGIVGRFALYVADLGDFSSHLGRVALYNDTTGEFLGNLDTAGFTAEFNPRGLVFGPDGLLYVSVVGNLAAGDQLTGYILRFNPENGRFINVFASNQDRGCGVHLHRPEGLAFGPDGNLYVTAFRADSSDTDKILIFSGVNGRCIDQIALDQVGQPRAFAQAILFGPGGFLFVPINNTGAVRRYDVANRSFPFTNFVPPGGPLGQPWYLTFGETDPGTLEYNPLTD